MKKNRQNFTINEKISEEFKKVCDDNSINMSKLIENYMVECIKKCNFDSNLQKIYDNLDEVKDIASSNFTKADEYSFGILKLSDYENEEIKARKIITRIVHSSNIIATQLRYGPANICIIGEKYYNIISKYLIWNDPLFTNGKDTRNPYLGDIKVIKNDNIGDFILSMRLISDLDVDIIKLCDDKIDLSKQYAGFEISE